MPNPNEDLISLILAIVKQQQNVVNVRDDELVDKLKIVSESVTLSESLTIKKNTHPVKYDDPEAIYDRCSYG